MQNEGVVEVDLDVALHFMNESDRCQYNLSTSFEEIAIILPRDGSEHNIFCDIIICLRSNGLLERIHEVHLAYLPFYYVLFFLHGTFGWYLDLRAQNIVMDIVWERKDAGRGD